MDPAQFFNENRTLVIGVIAGFVVIVGAIIGVVSMRGGPKLAAKWAHAAYGLWSGTEDSGTWPPARAQQSLKNWYGITDRASLMKMVEGLKGGVPPTAAWDQVRAVDLIRIGFAAGYLDEDDNWEKIRQIAEVIRSHYSDWESLGAAFESGMNAWQKSRNITDQNEVGRVQRNLPILRKDVWPKVKFSDTWD